MKSSALIFLLAGVSIFLCSCGSTQQIVQRNTQKKLRAIFIQNFQLADTQLQFLMQQLPAGKFPKTYHPTTGTYEFSGSDWWCSGFYPGSLLYTFQQTGDSSLLNEAKRMLLLLEKEQYNTSTHDLGFMMYGSFGNALKIAPQESYKKILIQSARSLCKRFDPTVGCIKSWDSKKNDFLVIIDNMMNLELLFWATRETGDSVFYKTAIAHANTTMKNHFRSDFSSYHVINYDANNGTVLQKKTAQGYADNSAWARGQAWGLYGFTVMYRETKDRIYLEQARRIANYLLQHPNRTADGVPYWDYNAPNIPNALRDASAGAVMASAYLELMDYVDPKEAATMKNAAIQILNTLSTPTYLAPTKTIGGFILQHSVGHIPQKTEVDVPLTYADYYFLEAMQRYLSLK